MASLPALLLFARVPRAGAVKTRLAARLGEDGALRLYRAFLEDAGRAYARPARWESVLCGDPDGRDAAFDDAFPRPWRRASQASGDLGRRLAAAFEEAFDSGAPAAAAVGADHPALPAARLVELFDALAAGASASLIPADDGGYCAIGLTAGVSPRLVFDAIAWSTDGVLEATVARLAAAGVAHRVLAPAYDVDRPEDLDRLGRDLSGRDPGEDDYPRATAAALRALAPGGEAP